MIKKLMPSGLKKYLRKKLLGVEVATYFFSQGGEDAILMGVFDYVLKLNNGFFVDVGAYHPHKGSNTFLLYRRGWNGINIEPNPVLFKEFETHRTRDINLQIGISKAAGLMDYYVIEGTPSMNSFSLENIERLGMKSQVTQTLRLPVLPLKEVFDKHLEGKNIDFLNIDTEGYEMEVLESNDWEKYKPSVIAIEQNNIFSLQDVLTSRVNEYLSGQGYIAFAKNLIVKDVATVFYIKNDLRAE
jgi:FkbM family methyltransferase